MKSSQIIVLGVALVAAIGAGVVAKNFIQPSQPERVVVEEVAEAEPPIALEEVLVAAAEVPMGEPITEEQMRWQKWPADALDEQYILRSGEADAVEELIGATVRLPLAAGEPIRKNRLVGFGQNYMSTILPRGKRALAINISITTTAGGFVLPNDFVDLLAIRVEGEGMVQTEVVLENVRVLAIDQYFRQGPEGQQVATGSTATLELTPAEVELVTIAEETSDRLSLVLRSVKDMAQREETGIETQLRRAEHDVRLIKGGQSSN